jgi:hypothetical protein
VSTAARRAHTRQLRRHHDPGYRFYAGGDRRAHIVVRITGDATGAMRDLAAVHRHLARVAAWSAQRTAELGAALLRGREANRLQLWRRLAEIDPQLRVFTVTIATPTGSECRLVVQRSDWRRMPAPTTEKE